jgi:hypothetical protein
MQAFPGPGPAAGETGGQDLISRADREGLRHAAARTGGLYIDGNDPAAPALLAERLARDSESALREAGNPGPEETGFRREPKSQRHLFILAALAFFGLSKLLACEFRRPPFPGLLPGNRRPRRA